MSALARPVGGRACAMLSILTASTRCADVTGSPVNGDAAPPPGPPAAPLPQDASIRLTAATIAAPAADVIRLRARAIARTSVAMAVITFPPAIRRTPGVALRLGP